MTRKEQPKKTSVTSNHFPVKQELDLGRAALCLRGVLHGLRMIADRQVPKDPHDAYRFKQDGALMYVLEHELEAQIAALDATTLELQHIRMSVHRARRPTA